MAEDSRNALRLAIATGVLAIVGTVVAGLVKGFSDVELAKRKLNSDLLMLALQSGSPDERLQSLQFMVDTHLIGEPQIAKGLDEYVAKHQKNPSTIPQFKHAAQGGELTSPIVQNARIFLLAGEHKTETLLPALRDALLKAGFNVLGEKLLIDPERPDKPEIRYFNANDALQAEQLAAFLRARLSDQSVAAKKYDDPGAKAGYVEVWMGR